MKVATFLASAKVNKNVWSFISAATCLNGVVHRVQGLNFLYLDSIQEVF
jgi:hypothetical protein